MPRHLTLAQGRARALRSFSCAKPASPVASTLSATAARAKPRALGGVPKRRRTALPAAHHLHQLEPVLDDDPTPSLISVHPGSASHLPIRTPALVDDTHHGLFEVSSDATGILDVTAKSVRYVSPAPRAEM